MHAVMGTGRLIAGRYRLQGPIGRGAMGIVWRGRDELLARDVAVKEVQITAHASPADAEVIYQRTLREARTAARLAHPNVVTVFDVVDEDGSPWIIMELVKARSLDRVITEDGPLPPLQAAELGTGLVGALGAAHSAGVLHRDVKPSNVLVTDDGKAVLTDFGIATFAEDPGMTQAGLVVGTPGFTAPERVRGDAATPASDLWSLGATLYAAVEGRGPFDRVGGSTAITAGVATEDAPRAPSAGPLGPVIDALLSRDAGSRPDVTTAARLLSEAATAARTGARSLGEGWLAAEASTAAGRLAAGGASVIGDLGSGSPGAASSAAAGAGAAGPGAGGSGAGGSGAGGSRVGGSRVGSAAGAAAAASGAAAIPGAGPGAAANWPAASATSGAAPRNLTADTDVAQPGAGLAPGAGGSAYAPAAPAEPASHGADHRPVDDQRAAFLAPPVFAELAMPEMAGSPGDAVDHAALAGEVAAATAKPEPVLGSDGDPILWQPLKSPSGGTQGSWPGDDSGTGGTEPSGPGGPSGSGGPSGPGGSSGPGGPSGPGGGNGWLRFWNRSGPSKPSSGRWRLMVAGAGIAAIVVAALVGWDIYSHTQTTQALNPLVPGISGAAGSSTIRPGAHGSTSTGSKHGSTPSGKQGTAPPEPGHAAGSGKPTSGPSRKPSSSPSADTSPSTHPSSSATPTPTPSATPTPSPSTSPTAPVLPAGWVWHNFSAALLGTTAGFKIGLPALWTQNLTGEIAHFNQPVKNYHLTINVGLWTYTKPLAQAKYLAKKDSANYNHYTRLTLAAIGFKAIGGFRVAPAAELKFSWDKLSGGYYTEMVILVTLTTKSGPQPYTFSLWAPSASFAAAHGVFNTALKTFRPLPYV